MKSTGSNCGFYMYNSSGTQIGQLYFNGSNLVTNKPITGVGTVSTTDLTAGTSALTTNQLYFVYA